MKSKEVQQEFGLADLRDWAAVTRGVKPAIRLGVIGDPVSHSLSPVIQNAALRECGIDAQYAKFHLSGPELREAFELFRNNGFIGLNVTLPHKQAATAFMDELDETATQVSAINMVSIRDGKLFGANTDGIGFSRAIRDEFSIDLRDLRILILGAGGAARAIACECARQNCERLVIANRTREHADKLVQTLHRFFAGPRVLGPVARLQATGLTESELHAQIPNTDLVVNATPLGLQRSDPAPIPTQTLEPHLMIYDTVYGSGRTPLLAAAQETGARGANGLSMLLHQGARSFEIWFDREPPVLAMRSSLGT